METGLAIAGALVVLASSSTVGDKKLWVCKRAWRWKCRGEVILESLSKPGRKRQREEPGKYCFSISDVFATPLIILAKFPRQTGHHEKAQVDKLLQDMLANDVIEECTSPWASPIVLATKKDGSTRFCVDYRRLNSVTEDTTYPFPRIEETLDSLGNSQWFSTLDLASGYWQVELAEDAKPKSAFVTHRGLHQVKVIALWSQRGPGHLSTSDGIYLCPLSLADPPHLPGT